MSRATIWNILLATLVVVACALHLAARPDDTKRNYEVLPDMQDPIPYESQGSNPNFPDGRNLQSPPAGAIARGFPPLHLGEGDAEALRAGRELRNPFEKEDASAGDRGGIVWGNFCAVCHGFAGLGDGAVTRRGVAAPPSLLAPQARARADGEIFHFITYGKNRGNMPAYASQIDREDRWKVILYVRDLQERASTEPAGDTPPSDAAEENREEKK